MTEITNTMYSWGQSQNTEDITNAAFLHTPYFQPEYLIFYATRVKANRKETSPCRKLNLTLNQFLLKPFSRLAMQEKRLS